MIIFDIETGPLPDEQLREMFTEKTLDEFAEDCDKRWKPETVASKYEEYKANAFPQFRDKAALSAVTGQVVAIGYWSIKDDKPPVYSIGDATKSSEIDMLDAFWSLYVKCRKTKRQMCGHNIIGFDLPFMIRRSWMLNVDVPASVRPPPGRYFDSLFVDTQEVWLCGDRWGGTPSNLNIVSKAFGLTGKNGNGKDFAELLASDYDAAVNYLRNDLELTANVAARMGVI